MRGAVAGLLALAAAPAAAQDTGPARHLPELRACLAASDTMDGDRACEGLVHRACEAGQGAGERHTTIGMSRCALTEAAAWDVLLNEAWKPLRASAKRQDAEDGGGRADTLLRAQRAWIAFRDADCAYEYARWGLGSMRQITGAACMARRNAERVRDFRAWLREDRS